MLEVLSIKKKRKMRRREKILLVLGIVFFSPIILLGVILTPLIKVFTDGERQKKTNAIS
ncbi:MAG: hypothetical protein ACTSUR_02520 [Candidatus Heimdallarchaeaceae archaeon]